MDSSWRGRGNGEICGSLMAAAGIGGQAGREKQSLDRGEDEVDGDGQTGVFFDTQTPEAIVAAVAHLDRRLSDIDPKTCRANAERFSTKRFHRDIASFADAALTKLRTEMHAST